MHSQTGAKRLSDNEWQLLANDCWQKVIVAIAARQALEENLRMFNALYELEVEPKDFPFVDSSNIMLPIVPSKLEALLAQVVAITFVPEFYIINGLTQDAGETAHLVQEYYNHEFRRQRGQSTWFQSHLDMVHLGLRDGTSVMEVMWKRRTRTAMFGVKVPRVEDGLPQIDPETGEPMWEHQSISTDVIDYDDVDLRPVWLRDFLLLPDESISIESAAGVARAEWFYESDLNAMVEEGILNAEWVERALQYDPEGFNDVAADRQGIYDKTIGGQINVGPAQGGQTSPFFKNRGPLKVWRIHDRTFDLNEDGIAEENVLYLHDQSGYLLGWVPDGYVSPTRPFFKYCPFPRPDRFYGFSLCERLGPITAEINLIHNQRNDKIDLTLNPPLLVNRTEEIYDKKMQWGPGKQWPVTDINSAAKYIDMPDIPLATWQEESLLSSYADQVSGLNGPMAGGQSTGRRSAKEMEIAASGASVRAQEIALLTRFTSRAILEFVHQLKCVNLPEPKPGDLPVNRETLNKPYKLDVAGTSDPLDKQTHVMEVQSAFNLLQNNPDVMQDAVHRHNLVKMMLQAIGISNIEGIIGTDDEAKQRQQAEQQANQQRQQIEQQMAQAEIQQKMHGGTSGARDNASAKEPPAPPQSNGAPPPGAMLQQ